MKQIIKLLSVLLFLGCSSRHPIPSDLEGEWTNPSGAYLVFNESGSFSGKYLPTELFDFTNKSKIRLEGTGSWKLIENQSLWMIELSFDSTNFSSYETGFGTHVQVAGHGFLDKEPPFYPFLWIGEEGEDMFEFNRIE